MLKNRLVRTFVTVVLAVMIAGLPAAFVGPCGSDRGGWTEFMADQTVVFANEECVVNEDGSTDNCGNSGTGGSGDSVSCIVRKVCSSILVWFGWSWVCQVFPCG